MFTSPKTYLMVVRAGGVRWFFCGRGVLGPKFSTGEPRSEMPTEYSSPRDPRLDADLRWVDRMLGEAVYVVVAPGTPEERLL